MKFFFLYMSILLRIAAPFIILGIFISAVQFVYLFTMLKYVYKIENYSPWTIFGIVFFAGMVGGLGLWSIVFYVIIVGYALHKYNLSLPKIAITIFFLILLTTSTYYLGLKMMVYISKGVPQQNKTPAIFEQWKEYTSIKDSFKIEFKADPTVKQEMLSYNSKLYLENTYNYFEKKQSVSAGYSVVVFEDKGYFDPPQNTGNQISPSEFEYLKLEKAFDAKHLALNNGFKRGKFNNMNALTFAEDRGSFEKGVMFLTNNKFYIIKTELFVSKQNYDKFLKSFSLIDTNSNTPANSVTSTSSLDTDGDGINDEIETLVYDTDPNSVDTDKDGISDFDEIRNNTIPNDSDNDRLPDNLEIIFKTNPNNKDSDGDGYSDYDEINSGFNPNGPGKMNTTTN